MDTNTSEGDHQFSFKFVFAGDSGVGKTSICNFFWNNKFDENQGPTIGIDFGSRIVEIENKKVKLQIWDTAGQERFRSFTKSYFRSSAAIFLVYDVTNRDSFINIGTWAESASQSAPPESVKVIIGNKTDLADKRAVSTSEAKDFAEAHGFSMFETSALSGDKVEDALMETACLVYKKIKNGEIKLNPLSGARAPLGVPFTENSEQSNSQGCC